MSRREVRSRRREEMRGAKNLVLEVVHARGEVSVDGGDRGAGGGDRGDGGDRRHCDASVSQPAARVRSGGWVAPGGGAVVCALAVVAGRDGSGGGAGEGAGGEEARRAAGHR